MWIQSYLKKFLMITRFQTNCGPIEWFGHDPFPGQNTWNFDTKWSCVITRAIFQSLRIHSSHYKRKGWFVHIPSRKGRRALANKTIASSQWTPDPRFRSSSDSPKNASEKVRNRAYAGDSYFADSSPQMIISYIELIRILIIILILPPHPYLP